MASMVRGAMESGAAVELCESVQAAIERAEAHRRAHVNRVRGRAVWSVAEEARRERRTGVVSAVTVAVELGR
jgi:hypothetical protein